MRQEAGGRAKRARGWLPAWAWAVLGLVLAAGLGAAACAPGQGGGDTPTPAAPIETPALAEPQVRQKDGMVMVPVPAGAFPMGSSDAQIQAAVAQCTAGGYAEADCKSWIGVESPQHSVTLDAFWIDRTEVTNAQYGQCVADGACPEMACPDETTVTGDSQPVVCVNWAGASAYCAWAGARLPSEAEWEKAARGTDSRVYPWGDSLDAGKANYCDSRCTYDWKDAGADDGFASTAPVGSYPDGASPYGVLDMAGNAWEWVSDWYDAGYYAVSPERNPPGPESRELRLLRGGCWDNPAGALRSTYRLNSDAEMGLDGFGFRCAASTAPGP